VRWIEGAKMRKEYTRC